MVKNKTTYFINLLFFLLPRKKVARNEKNVLYSITGRGKNEKVF